MQPEIHPAERDRSGARQRPAAAAAPQGRPARHRHPRRRPARCRDFLAGIQAQKQWGDNSANAGGFGARAAAFRRRPPARQRRPPARQGGQGDGGFFGRRGGGFTTGTVKLVQGSTHLRHDDRRQHRQGQRPELDAITKSVTRRSRASSPATPSPRSARRATASSRRPRCASATPACPDSADVALAPRAPEPGPRRPHLAAETCKWNERGWPSRSALIPLARPAATRVRRCRAA